MENRLDYMYLPIQGLQDQYPASPLFRMRLETEIPSPYDLVGGALNLSSLSLSEG